MANGMGSLYIGVSGLQSAQAALNTTAHNLSNVGVDGYTRQQITFGTATYLPVGGTSLGGSEYGLGVAVEDIRRIRDRFIDEAYRSENSRYGFYKSQYDAVEEVEDLFGEMQGVTYQDCLKDLNGSINELSKNPTSTVARASLIQTATAFLSRSDTIYNSLVKYQTTLNTQIMNMVNKINSLGKEIYSLNNSIADIEGAGVESANDLRDQRDNALDELSEYMKVEYYEVEAGKINVVVEGIPFVTQSNVNTMDVKIGSERGVYTPIWPGFDRDVFSEDISKAQNYTNTDKGKLKGLIIARGNVQVDYTDVPIKPESTDYDLTTPEGLAAYNEAYEEYQDKQEYYNKYIEPSAILSAFAGLDKLVNGIIEGINDILCPEVQEVTNAAIYDINGDEVTAVRYEYDNSTQAFLYNVNGERVDGKLVNDDPDNPIYSYDSQQKLYKDMAATQEEPVDRYTYSYLDQDSTSYGMDDDRTIGSELFSRKETPRYIETVGADGKTVYYRNNLNDKGDVSLYAIGNVVLNEEVTQNVAKLPLTTLQGGEDFSKAQELVDLWSEKFASLNPEQYSKSDFNSFYNNFIGEFATAGQVLDTFVSHQQTMVDGYDSQRQQVQGVSSDEELQKMIKFQQAYNAASRYINVVDDMLDHIISRLGS